MYRNCLFFKALTNLMLVIIIKYSIYFPIILTVSTDMAKLISDFFYDRENPTLFDLPKLNP